MKTIGIVGMGIIGLAWARRHEAAGTLAGTWNRTLRAEAPRPLGGPEEVAASSDVIQIVVADPKAVGEVIARLVPRLRAGKVVVQSSTIDPASSGEFKAQVEGAGARYLEAPFTGSKPAAEAGQTVYYLGGDADLAATIEPLLKVVSEHRFHIGDHRQACALKLAMNLNIAAQMQGLSEALTLSRTAGIRDDVFFDALSRNVSQSGLARLKEPKLRTGDFAPQFSTKHMHKDMRLAAGMAGPGFPLLNTVRTQLGTAEAKGFGDDDFSSLIRLL
jgi:3-hydroxyisobutyrate dehydrogenase-like beta-hydroxyacid dehydrogenase